VGAGGRATGGGEARGEGEARRGTSEAARVRTAQCLKLTIQ
jgi:hypothetical protein